MTSEQFLESLGLTVGIIVFLKIFKWIVIIALVLAIFTASSNLSKILELLKDMKYMQRVEFEEKYDDYEEDEYCEDLVENEEVKKATVYRKD